MVRLVSKRENILLFVGIILLVVPALITCALSAIDGTIGEHNLDTITSPASNIVNINDYNSPFYPLYNFVCFSSFDRSWLELLIIAGGLIIICTLLYKIIKSKSKRKLLKAAFVVVGIGVATAFIDFCTAWASFFLCWQF